MERSRRLSRILDCTTVGRPAGLGAATRDRTWPGGRQGAGTRGLSPPFPHHPSASRLPLLPPLPSRAPPSLPAHCPPDLSLCPFPSCNLSPGGALGLSWGRPAWQACLCHPCSSQAWGPTGALQSGAWKATKPGLPGQQVLCGEKASTNPEPSRGRGEPDIGPLPTPGNPRASSQGMCGVPAGVPRKWQVVAVASLGPSPPPPSATPSGPPAPISGAFLSPSSAWPLPTHLCSNTFLLPCAHLCPRPKWPPAPPPFTCPSRPPPPAAPLTCPRSG